MKILKKFLILFLNILVISSYSYNTIFGHEVYANEKIKSKKSTD